jgi:hypothetical protein
MIRTKKTLCQPTLQPADSVGAADHSHGVCRHAPATPSGIVDPPEMVIWFLLMLAP